MAQTVYTCAGPQGPVYQSLPCPVEADTGQTRRYVRDPKLSYEERSRNARMLEDARRRMQADAGRGNPGIRGSVIDSARDPEGCENARDRQEFVEFLGGKSRAEKLDGEVRDACRRP